MRDVFIVAAARTPIGRFGGALKDHSAADLGAIVMKAALERGGVDGSALDFYTLGNILSAGQGQLIPRQAALKAGISAEVDGFAVDMVCSSGMMAVMSGATAIKAEEADLVLAGGTESMTRAGFYLSHQARWGYKLMMGGGDPIVDILMVDGLTDPMTNEAMGDQTERLLLENGITRLDLDRVALTSHLRAAEAQRSGLFAEEMVPVEVKARKGSTWLDHDEGVRPDTTLETLSELRSAFRKDGFLTAGNSSQISDGAAALLLASQEAVDRYGLTPLARIMGSTMAAGETWRFPEAPVPAVRKLLGRLGMRIEDFGVVENNEAFAINNLLFEQMLGVSPERQNVLGGAIALGHPIGASGARILVTLLSAMKAKDAARGLAAICHGTGGGTALALERV